MALVAGSGELLRLSRKADGELLDAAVVGLGSLGVITSLTLAVAPAFAMHQQMYDGLALEQLEAQFDALMGRAYSVSVFTDWMRRERTQVS